MGFDLTFKGLNQQLSIQNLLPKEQYGYRKDRSTQAPYTLTDGILKAWNSNSQVAGIFCDLAKFFDSVNLNTLVEKLKYCGVNKTHIDWIKSCLHNKTES